jgi:transcriptional regulator with XRE-family HTH domain
MTTGNGWPTPSSSGFPGWGGRETAVEQESPGAAFPAILRASREAALLTQESLARRSGLSVRTIRNLERGKTRQPYHDTVESLAQGLALDAAAADRLRESAGSARAMMLETAFGVPPPTSLPPITPRQLPIDARHFVGRGRELFLLDEFAASNISPGTSLIALLYGAAGVGKTGLAVRWAHLARHRFPDGQLYVHLGDDNDSGCADEAVLPGCLRALGIPDHAIPARGVEQSALFRSLVADRRMLILIDNACRSRQVRSLLPATDRCLVLVTSRWPLRSLVADDGAHRLSVDVLSEADAIRLIHALVGDRVLAEPSAARELVCSCGLLPRALRVAAEFIARYPALSLRALVRGLMIPGGRAIRVRRRPSRVDARTRVTVVQTPRP